MSIRVSIIEDDVEIASFLKAILHNNERIALVSIHHDAESFIEEVSQLHCEVVLIDIELPGMSGIECVRTMKPHHTEIQFLMFSVFEDYERLFEALCAGATGYLTKNSSAEKLLSSIEEIHNGGSPMSPAIARMVVQRFKVPPTAHQSTETLSVREHEILNLLSKGLRYKEIAAELFISVETVRKHARNIYGKLQVTSRTEAINAAFGQRLI
jgi:DNA-binding NarL/FixJ family response regulator